MTTAAHEKPAPKTPPPSAGGREYWITLFGSLVLRLLVLTLRLRVEDPSKMRELRRDGPYILVFWHNRLLLVPSAWNRFFARYRPTHGVAMTSTSRDGELIAQFLRHFGMGSVRGSATRRGSVALRELVRATRHGHDNAITPDGSRGPLYEVKGGLILAAQLAGKPLLPVSFEYSSAWRLKGWDRFFIPKPFSRITVILGDLYTVKRTSSEEEFEHERRRCQEMMMALVRER